MLLDPSSAPPPVVSPAAAGGDGTRAQARALRQELASARAEAARRERVLNEALRLERSRVVELGERLGLSALAAQPVPRSRPELAGRVRAELQALLERRGAEAGRLHQLLEAAEHHCLWAHLVDAQGAPFRSLEAFVTAPRPHGLGVTAAVVEGLLREKRDYALQGRLLAARAKPLRPPGIHRTPTNEATTATCVPGTSAHYLVSKLARDKPEFVERLRRGEFGSAHAAAVAAGLATPHFTVRVDVYSVARQLIRRFSPADVRRIVELLVDTSWLGTALGNAQMRRRSSTGTLPPVVLPMSREGVPA